MPHWNAGTPSENVYKAITVRLRPIRKPRICLGCKRTFSLASATCSSSCSFCSASSLFFSSSVWPIRAASSRSRSFCRGKDSESLHSGRDQHARNSFCACRFVLGMTKYLYACSKVPGISSHKTDTRVNLTTH